MTQSKIDQVLEAVTEIKIEQAKVGQILLQNHEKLEEHSSELKDFRVFRNKINVKIAQLITIIGTLFTAAQIFIQSLL